MTQLHAYHAPVSSDDAPTNYPRALNFSRKPPVKRIVRAVAVDLLATKLRRRSAFLKECGSQTRAIHLPLLDLRKTKGFLNPTGLGDVENVAGIPGQSTVAFESCLAFEQADRGHSLYGGAEYGIVNTAESAAVCKKFAQLHGGAGAILLPSGLSALSTTFLTFLSGEAPTILIPDNRYYPAERALNAFARFNPNLRIYHYRSRADGEEIQRRINQAKRIGRSVGLIYLEAPGSHTFEIPDIREITAVAKQNGILTVMDNTWASHVRCKPLEHGVNLVVQATTKYEAGYADTPSGVVIADKDKNYQALAAMARALGVGAVCPQTCQRLLARVDLTKERLDRHYQSALQVIRWFQQQRFTQEVFCPFLPTSPDYQRFQKYFKKGNGLFTVVFDKSVTAEKLRRLLDDLLLVRIGEGWAGHVSLALKVEPARTLAELPPGQKVRFSIGLEDPEDLIRDLTQAAKSLGGVACN